MTWGLFTQAIMRLVGELRANREARPRDIATRRDVCESEARIIAAITAGGAPTPTEQAMLEKHLVRHARFTTKLEKVAKALAVLDART